MISVSDAADACGWVIAGSREPFFHRLINGFHRAPGAVCLSGPGTSRQSSAILYNGTQQMQACMHAAAAR